MASITIEQSDNYNSFGIITITFPKASNLPSHPNSQLIEEACISYKDKSRDEILAMI